MPRAWIATLVLVAGCHQLPASERGADAPAASDAMADATADCGATEQTGSDGIVVDVVPPSCTGAGITSWTEPHYALRDPSVASNGMLLVFFPGTGLLPSDYQLVLAAAAHQGYLAIGLRYANDKDVGAISDSSDPNCTEEARLEIFDGTDRSSDVAVGPADSVVGRLVALLGWLDTAHPGRGWGSFVANGAPTWTSIAVGGHSLGGGEAALIATKFAVPRVAMFSAPNDHACGNANKPAGWEMSSALLTPAVRWFGLGHLWDTTDEPLELAAWSAFGMDPFGNPASSVNVEKVGPPYEGAHELKTDALPSTCTTEATCAVNDAHRSTAVDANTPLDGDTPHLLPPWQYVLGPS